MKRSSSRPDPLQAPAPLRVRLAVGLIRCYQLCLSPLLGPRCRFHPTCSEYCLQCIQKYGVLRGMVRGGIRISKCHPFHPGGIDPP